MAAMSSRNRPQAGQTADEIPPGGHASSPAERPAPREVVEPVVAPHLERFSQVMTMAWDSFTGCRERSPGQMGQAGAAARGMLISDFMRAPAHAVFAGVPGARVVTRFQRPWVHLDGGEVQVRFKVLTPALGIAPGQSERAMRLAYHLRDETLLEEPKEATILTAGYVLDAAQSKVERMALVCLLGYSQVHYWFPLPGGAAQAAPTQLPLTPLSAPIIRSARAAAEKRLADGAQQP